MGSLAAVKSLLRSYKDWVITNPNMIGDVETVSKWTCYLIAGKVNKSPVISELVYSLSNLFVLYNDSLIMKYQSELAQGTMKNKREASLKYWMTVLHFTEVFIEMTARHKWGIRGKWTAATLVQILKCISNLILVYRYKNVPVKHPPVSGSRNSKQDNGELQTQEGFRLKRSGRVVRRVEDAPYVQMRNWKAPMQDPECKAKPEREGDDAKRRLAETLYIVKPLLHLASVAKFGSQSWQQWLWALGLDLTSLYLFEERLDPLTYQQRIEISRRKLSLIYYLLRSPMYNKYSRSIINRTLDTAASKIPLARIVCNPIKQYLPVWQETYFYMWDN